MRVHAFVALMALSFAAASAPADTEFRLDIEYKKTYTFVEARGDHNIQSMFGSYIEPMALTGGDTLNIYPNGKFTIIHWCDICPPSLLARGTYTFNDSVFKFNYLEKKDGSTEENSPSELIAFHGWIELKPGVVTGSTYILMRRSRIDAARKDRDFLDFMRQDTWYPDWQTMYEKDLTGD